MYLVSPLPHLFLGEKSSIPSMRMQVIHDSPPPPHPGLTTPKSGEGKVQGLG